MVSPCISALSMVLLICCLMIPIAGSETATLMVNSSPLGANITFAGVLNGTTPATISGIEPGNYSVHLSMPGYADYFNEIAITRPESILLHIDLDEGTPDGVTGGSDHTSDTSVSVSVDVSDWTMVTGFPYATLPSVIIVNPSVVTEILVVSPTPAPTTSTTGSGSSSSPGSETGAGSSGETSSEPVGSDGSESSGTTGADGEAGSSTSDSATEESSTRFGSLITGPLHIPSTVPTPRTGETSGDDEPEETGTGMTITSVTQIPSVAPTPRLRDETSPIKPFKAGVASTRIPTVRPTPSVPPYLQDQVDQSEFTNPLVSSGKMTLTSYPSGADVMVDGQMKGKTPLTLESATPGVHQVEISNPGYQQYKTSYQVQPGMQSGMQPQMQVNLKPSTVKKTKKPKIT